MLQVYILYTQNNYVITQNRYFVKRGTLYFMMLRRKSLSSSYNYFDDPLLYVRLKISLKISNSLKLTTITVRLIFRSFSVNNYNLTKSIDIAGNNARLST